MSTVSPSVSNLSLDRWIGVPAQRAGCVIHFAAIATVLAVAKVLLATVAFGLFLANEGPAQLPVFYLLLAGMAITLSLWAASLVDRVPKIRLAQFAFGGVLIAAAALRMLLWLDHSAAYFLLLASAHLYEIVVDIVFWVVIAAFIDSVELRRATPFVYMGIAVGGAVGGGLAHALATLFPPADLLWALPIVAFAVIAQLQVAGRRLEQLHDRDQPGEDETGLVASLAQLVALVRGYPLALLIALNALVLTILYGLSEYLVFVVYSERFVEERELTRFLAVVFAGLQVSEFALLYAVTRPLLQRTGPLLRNLVFPATSLLSLVYLLTSQKLPAAIVTHLNAEAVSNAIFQPVNTANYVPLPLRFQGRARTLSDGIFYPSGLALAGAILVLTPGQGATGAVGFVAIVFVLIFALFSAGAGLLFLPTMRANVGSGLIRPGRSTSVAMPAAHVRMLLESREAELRLMGLSLARQLGPDGLDDDLLALAAHPDRATRAALARLIAAAPRIWAQDFLDRCLAGQSEAQLKLALVVMLIRQTRPTSEQMGRVFGARDPVVLALGHAVANGAEAWPKIQPIIQSSRVSSDLVDAIVAAERADLAPLLLECFLTAEPEQQWRALVLLNGSAAPPRLAPTDIVRRLTMRPDPAVRAEAIVCLSRTTSRTAAVRQLIAALDDPDGRVRRRVAEALWRCGDRAAALLRHRLGTLTSASLDAVWVLARIGSPRARRVLADYLRKLHQEAQRTARLLEWIEAPPNRVSWPALGLCLRDHQACMVDVVLAALSPALEPRLAAELRAALRGSDQRRRANAFELIAAVPASRLPPDAVELLRCLLSGTGASAGGRAPRVGGPEAVVDQALASMSPWVRRATALGLARARRPSHVLPSAGVSELFHGNGAGDHDMGMDHQEFERIIALKRMPLFRYVPFDTIADVARSVQVRTYLAGEEVVAAGARRQDLLILEAGVLTIADLDGGRTLAAPACFGEVALSGERMSWPKITAREDARVSFLRAGIFEQLCREHPDIAIELCRLLARRLQGTGEAQANTAD